MSMAQPLSRVDAFKRKGGDHQPRPSIWSLLPERLRLALPRTGWALVSIGLFACLWELLWAFGVSDPRLLPPPHIFLGNFPEQLKFFVLNRGEVFHRLNCSARLPGHVARSGVRLGGDHVDGSHNGFVRDTLLELFDRVRIHSEASDLTQPRQGRSGSPCCRAAGRSSARLLGRDAIAA